MANLTPRQQTILTYIRDLDTSGEPPPTVRQIMDALDISSTSIVNRELDVLTSAGHIRRERGISRGIRLMGKGGEDRLSEALRLAGMLAEIVKTNQVQIEDLQAEVARLGKKVEEL